MKLPTDEEICEHYEGVYLSRNMVAGVAFYEASKWMRDTYCRPLAEENDRLQMAIQGVLLLNRGLKEKIEDLESQLNAIELGM